jgi:integrase
MEAQRHELELEAARLAVPTVPSKDYYDLYVEGLSLRVTNTGRRTWYFVTKIKGVKHRTKIGTFHAKHFSYRKASDEAARLRMRADDARAGLARNPVEVKAAERAARKSQQEIAARKKSGADSFGNLCDLYLVKYAEPRKKSVDADRQMIENVLKPPLGDRDAKEVTRRDVRELIDSILTRGKGVMANRVLSLIKAIFNFGIDQELIEVNPCAGIKKQFKEVPRKKVFKFDDSDVRNIWRALEKCDARFAKAARLAILLGQREGEILGIARAEINFDEASWTIPAERTKTNEVHVVPLVGMAWEIVSGAFTDPERIHLFPEATFRSGGNYRQFVARHIKTLRDAAPMAGLHFHDLRHVTATGIVDVLGPADGAVISNKVLNHSAKGMTAQRYVDYKYEKEMREALTLWDRKLLREIVPGLKVVPPRSADQAVA